MRERLKSDFGVVKNSKGKLGIDCVFSTEALVYPQADGSVCAMKSSAEGPKRMDCASGFWRGHHGDRDLWFYRRVSRPEKDDGEGGTSGLTRRLQHRLAQGIQSLAARGAQLSA
ncbi:sulfur acceptor protein CsdL [Leclercia adecarboxylata]|uniref:Sulfur acceptor protein CsdL n=1 Tax=Leclercia adecarboxylata TaxID=83655 RepID=A0A4U9IJ63_9ENTR|nr:sulfur acceptor protein CsdL [Leclercia adecarboxylata]